MTGHHNPAQGYALACRELAEGRQCSNNDMLQIMMASGAQMAALALLPMMTGGMMSPQVAARFCNALVAQALRCFR